MRIKWIFVVILAVLVIFSVPASAKETIIIADQTWESGMFHSRVVAIIIKEGFGYPVELMPGENMPIKEALAKGRMHIMMESWHHSWIDFYEKAIANGSIVDLGPNFQNAQEGWYVPTYVIKGDAKRDIKPMAPDLKHINDLRKYWQLFRLEKSSKKGTIHSGGPGWGATANDEKKIKAYGLDDVFEQFVTGSGAALAAAFTRAYEKGGAVIGYWWSPTWLLHKYDLTKLEEPPHDSVIWGKNRGCAYPPGNANIVVAKDLLKIAPAVVEFLRKYETGLALNNEILSHKKAHKLNEEQIVNWFLKERPDLWTKWVPSDVAAKVRQALK